MLATYLTAIAGVIAAQAAPGPNVMAVVGVGLAQGRRAAFLVVAGVATGVILWAALFAYGLGQLIEAVPACLIGLEFVGGAYLLYVGARAVIAALRGETQSIRAAGTAVTALGAWRRGLLVVITNPKAALMWSAVATFLFGSGLNQVEVLAFGPLAAISAVVVYSAYAMLFSSATVGALYRRFTVGIEVAMGAVFGALGLVLIGAGVRAIRP